jgi:hypothetical protein
MSIFLKYFIPKLKSTYSITNFPTENMSKEQKDIGDFLEFEDHKKLSNNKPFLNPPKNREELIQRLITLKELGWIQMRHQVNDGLVGNTLEDFLNIKENNLQLPDAGKYELKCQRIETSSLTTLFHLDPFPRKPESVVTKYLGPVYGWDHKKLKDEWSFRITMYGNEYTNRGFKVAIDEQSEKLIVDFNPQMVDPENQEWLTKVIQRGGRTLNPQPYWKLDELRAKAQRKITNTIYAKAESRKRGAYEEFQYISAILYEGFDFDKFKNGLLNGTIFVDFDARKGHNHGTKFRMKQTSWNRFFASENRLF